MRIDRWTEVNRMNTSRILGGLLCAVSVFVAVIHIYFGYIAGSSLIPPQGLAFALPVTAMILVATGLGAWLGWIMATTKEAAPAPAPTMEEEEEESEKEEEESEELEKEPEEEESP